VVHLEDPRLQFIVEEDVEAENLEAHRIFDVIGLATAISVRQLWLHCAHRLDNCVFYVVHDPS